MWGWLAVLLARSTPTAEEIDRAVLFVYRTRIAGSRWSRVLTLLRSPLQIWMTMRLLARLPLVEVTTPARQPRPAEFYSPYDGSGLSRIVERLRCALRLPCLRVGQAVLRLPRSGEEYLRGHQRQAVRTNCTRAQALGMSVREVAGEDEGVRLLGRIVHGAQGGEPPLPRARSRGSRRPTQGLRTLAVYDAAGEVLGAASFYRSGPYARLEVLKCVSSEVSSLARYLLHTRLVETLIADGAVVLFADSGITVTPGLHYLHQRVGYEVINVRIRPARPARRQQVAPVRMLPRSRTQRVAARHRRTA